MWAEIRAGRLVRRKTVKAQDDKTALSAFYSFFSGLCFMTHLAGLYNPPL